MVSSSGTVLDHSKVSVEPVVGAVVSVLSWEPKSVVAAAVEVEPQKNEKMTKMKLLMVFSPQLLELEQELMKEEGEQLMLMEEVQY